MMVEALATPMSLLGAVGVLRVLEVVPVVDVAVQVGGAEHGEAHDLAVRARSGTGSAALAGPAAATVTRPAPPTAARERSCRRVVAEPRKSDAVRVVGAHVVLRCRCSIGAVPVQLQWLAEGQGRP